MTFDGFKIKARAEQNPEKAEEYGVTKKDGRRRQRKLASYNQRMSAVDEYKARYGLDPKLVISLDFISDYALGPETDSGETFEEWKRRMGKELGMSERRMGVHAWERTRFLEHIRPRWRSDKVSFAFKSKNTGLTLSQFNALLQKLQEIADMQAGVHERQRHRSASSHKYYRVDSTNRWTDLPPVNVPYNFSVAKGWYETMRNEPRWKTFFSVWMRFAGPEGWDTPDEGLEDEEPGDGDDEDNPLRNEGKYSLNMV
jgi:hypothetical protein